MVVNIALFVRLISMSHFGVKPNKGGSPPKENNRIIKDINLTLGTLLIE